MNEYEKWWRSMVLMGAAIVALILLMACILAR